MAKFKLERDYYDDINAMLEDGELPDANRLGKLLGGYRNVLGEFDER